MEISLSLIQQIGASLGVPAAVAFAIVGVTIRNINRRLDEGDRRMTKIEQRHEESEAMLQEIRANVAYIRGKMDKRGSK